MKSLRRWLSSTALLVSAALIAVACAGSTGGGEVIRIGSKDFTEQLILGEIYALVLEDAGTK